MIKKRARLEGGESARNKGDSKGPRGVRQPCCKTDKQMRGQARPVRKALK